MSVAGQRLASQPAAAGERLAEASLLPAADPWPLAGDVAAPAGCGQRPAGAVDGGAGEDGGAGGAGGTASRVAGVAAAQAAGGTRPDLGWFGRMLEQDEVVDLRTVALPGAAVTLPWGVALLRRFRQLLEPIFDACGYEEYELPDLAPEAVYEPALRAFPHHQHLLRAGDDGDWAVGRPRAVLAPTGEATVYAHWERTVRTSADLPIRLRRNARYFRPVPRGSRSGRGIFRPLEAPEVHEFHACFADRGAARAGLAQALEMVEQAGRALRVPVLWSTRPPWTNHADVADIAFGGDALLPSGGAVQVGCVYDQGQRFSRAYGIRLRDRNPPVHPFQVTGCVTRRLLLVHLFQHMTGSGELRLHPQVAPVQVAVHSTGDWPHRAFADALCAAGLRVTSAVHPDRRAAKAFDQRWRRRGVPVRVLVQPPRSDSDSTRVVLSRHTGRPEQVFHLASASHAVDAVADAVNAVGRELDAELSATVRRRVVPVADSPIADTLARRDVAVTPLQPTRAAVEALEGKYPGEVLGLQRGAEAAVCPVTGEQTTVRAFLAGRT